MTEKDRKRRLGELKRLFRDGAVYNGFASKQECLTWANEVLPLLNFNTRYQSLFQEGLRNIQLPLSMPSMELYHNQMVGQVEIAINDLDGVKGSGRFSGVKKLITLKSILAVIVILFIAYQVYLGAKIRKIGIPNVIEIELDHGSGN